MWIYQKKLEYPIRIRKPDARAAKIIMSQYGGPDGELGASLRYLSQRFAMPYKEVVGTLTDIGTEELAHLEMIGTIIYQLTRNLSIEQIKAQGFDDYFVDHTTGIWPSAASGMPFTSAAFQSKGDIIT
ncbi:MAG: manganese catalase family protein, partial [Clostridia bacterium]|nr:manganese catalase family protein [Clostridia bacterium]